MPTNLLLLPLLGGFWFVHFCYFFRFRAQRLDGYRLLLESAFFGLLFIVPARLITYYWPRAFDTGRLARQEWADLWGGAPLSGTATLSLLLGLISPFVINLTYAVQQRLQEGGEWPAAEEPAEVLLPAKVRALDWAIRNSGTYLHQLLHKSVLQQVPVLITLQNRKVYVGYVAESPNLKPENQYLWLLPALSGHRDDKTLKVEFDAVYPNPEDLPADLGIEEEDLLLTIPLSEVKSATLYYPELDAFILPYAPVEPAAVSTPA
ncbi:MAG: hypothetical protein ACJ75H_10760 [Thermoanaerobaculia bacterium]